jgi:UDP-N-acetylmuramoyl-tripeptide--D-alanyl-D-alanine ligase
MIQRTLQHIADMIGSSSEVLPRDQGMNIKGVSTDTRSILEGSLFIPIQGPRFNGHHYVREAIAKGAAASLWSRGEPDPPIELPLLIVEDTLAAIQQLAGAYRRQLQVKVVGITGSNGKTSTKDILASLLATQYKTQKTSGNLNNHLGVPLTLLQLEEDTEMAVIEMGMSGLGEIERLSRIAQPDAAIITNVSEVHLADLKSRDRIAQAKLEILSGLKPDGLFVFNGDNPLLIEQLGQIAANRVNTSTTFGEASVHTWHPTSFSLSESGVVFAISDPASPTLQLPLLGKHQMTNALGAIAVARHLGISYANIKEGLLRIEATGMRNERIRIGPHTLINDAYKSNPPSVRAALHTLYELKGYKRKIAVLGDMVELGEEAADMHREIGAELDKEHLDYLITLGSMANYIADSARAHFPDGHVFTCSTQQEVLLRLLEVTQNQDCLILIKGSRSLQMEHLVDAMRLKLEVRGA